jgi:galactitol-specific phosphotransferase system IIC component
MKKIDKIFLGLILVEIIVLGLLIILFNPSIVDCLLEKNATLPIEGCGIQPNAFIYYATQVLFYLLPLTILIYLIIIIKNIFERRYT